jgi:hypothetical protein
MMHAAILVGAIATTEVQSTREPVRESVSNPDKPRIRGGFSVGGGLVLGQSVDVGGTAGLALRLGAQINRWFAVQYQNSPNLFAYGSRQQSETIVGFIDTNSVLATVNLGDHLEVGAGPSLDIAALAGCSVATVRCDATRGVAPGMHGRAALILGGRDPQTGRRIGFAIGVDGHPIFFPNGDPVLLLGLNIGMEIY